MNSQFSSMRRNFIYLPVPIIFWDMLKDSHHVSFNQFSSARASALMMLMIIIWPQGIGLVEKCIGIYRDFYSRLLRFILTKNDFVADKLRVSCNQDPIHKAIFDHNSKSIEILFCFHPSQFCACRIHCMRNY